jgi:hypothetical protein
MYTAYYYYYTIYIYRYIYILVSLINTNYIFLCNQSKGKYTEADMANYEQLKLDVSNLKAESVKLTSELSEKEKERAKLQREVEEFRAKSEAPKEDLVRQSAGTSSDNTDSSNNSNNNSNNNNNNNNNNDTTTVTIAELQAKVDSLEAKNAKLISDNKDLTAQINQLKELPKGAGAKLLKLSKDAKNKVEADQANLYIGHHHY